MEKLREEIRQMTAIDAHCHPFLPNEVLNYHEFARSFSLTVLGPGSIVEDPRCGSGTVLQEFLLCQLSRLLDCRDLPDEVMERRNGLVAMGNQYTRLLFADAGLAGLVVDSGYPQPPIDLDDFRRRVPVPAWEVYRIEPLLQELLQEQVDFYSFESRYQEGIERALGAPGCVGLKSIIAYRTGLNVGVPCREEAERAYTAWQKDPSASLKTLRDYCLLKAFVACRETGKVMQVHTGAGDSEIHLATARPELLYEVLTTDPYRRTRTVLVHGGYPWTREAAFMVSVLENVYLDLSLISPFATFGVAKALEDVLAIAPVSKVMHGSDAFRLPEMNWVGALYTRQALAAVLGRLKGEGAISLKFALTAAEGILSGNARTVYRLGSWGCENHE